MMTLLKIRRSGEFLSLTTTDRTHGRSQRFLINTERLRTWLEADDGTTFFDRDLNNFVEFFRFNAEKVTLRLTWLKVSNGNGDLAGYRQTMIIPAEDLRKAIIGFRVKVLTDPDAIPQSKIVFSESAQAQIGKIIRDPKEKRALSKALRDNFHWRDCDEVYVVADWRHDFYFTTDGMNGGLIQHKSTKNGRESVCFSLHT